MFNLNISFNLFIINWLPIIAVKVYFVNSEIYLGKYFDIYLES